MVKKTQPQAQTCTGHKDNRGIIGQGVEVKVTKNRLLLHSCCGPCSTACVERLVPVYKVTIFFYNPNITDREEYEKRKESQIDFIKKYNHEFEKNVLGVTQNALLFLMENDWKGNVRELEHVIEAAMNMVESGQKIEVEHLPAYLTLVHPRMLDDINAENSDTFSLNHALENYEKKLIMAALQQSRWKIIDAAKKLQIPRTSLQYKMEKYGIKKNGNQSKEDGNPSFI